jgi:5S rRNA maturation endonuclease (ribonuclease M5)
MVVSKDPHSTIFHMGHMVTSLDEVPEDWIYKHYYKLVMKDKDDPLYGNIYQKFDGRIIKVRSFQNRDSNPSLCFFYKNPHYYWKDFSTGKGGNARSFVAIILNKTDSAAENNILAAYEDYLNDGGVSDQPVIHHIETKIEGESKMFTEYGLDFFKDFKITLSTLNYYSAKELESYTITKGLRVQPFIGFNFGYYCAEFGLYQIYNPRNESNKYLYVNPHYLIGRDQLQFKSKTCIIISGLKDIMALRDFNLDAEYIAGQSETCLLDSKIIDWLKSKYKNVLSMLDYDDAGLKAMRRYKAVYNIKPVVISLKKDLAENNKYFPLDYLRDKYTVEINKVLNS